VKEVIEISLKSCPKCKGNAPLHVGDRVAFGANKTYFSHSHLILKARLKGVIVNDLGKGTRYYVYNPGPKKDEDLIRPRAAGVKIIRPELFETYLSDLCRGNIGPSKKIPLAKLISQSAPIYEIGLTKQERIVFEKFAKRHKCRIFNVRKPSVVAVICNHGHINSGDADIFRSWGVPVYDFSRVKLDF
jgi:hypothetical protein